MPNEDLNTTRQADKVPLPEPHEAIARLRAYVARRKIASGLDIEAIHGFDVGPQGGCECRLSDIEALLSHREEYAQAQIKPLVKALELIANAENSPLDLAYIKGVARAALALHSKGA